ncbi:MAG: biopolymer transporter ExbD [Acidobacteria bacterium]|nr:biopolymer transporter ExbD [Acidobacteriota bacterium]
MAFSTPGPGALKSEINITPMIDVLLVLIIVFMVVVSMSKQKGLEAEIPRPANDHGSTEAVRTIVIEVGWAGENKPPALKINNQDVTWAKLGERLGEIFKQRAERVAFVQGDDSIDFEYVAEAIAIARNSGVDKIGLLTKSNTPPL